MTELQRYLVEIMRYSTREAEEFSKEPVFERIAIQHRERLLKDDFLTEELKEKLLEYAI